MRHMQDIIDATEELDSAHPLEGLRLILNELPLVTLVLLVVRCGCLAF